MDRFFLFRVTGQAGRAVARFAIGPFHALAVITLMAVAIPVGVGMPWSGGSTTVQAATAAATFTITAPGAAQPVGTPFDITANLSAVTFDPVNSPSWGGYDFELQYDNTLLSVGTVAPTLCPSAMWGNPQNVPNVVTGCAFQNSTATGVLETIQLTCIASGTSALHMLPRNDPQMTALGTALFDQNAVDFLMTYVDASVTCGTPPTGTATNTPSPTNTATPTSTFTPSPTVTPGPPPTTGCTTNVGGPPTLGIGQDCDLDVRFPLVWGDGCVDTEDVNPHDPWDFYSVPVPSLLAMPGALRDNAVTGRDAQAVFSYFRVGAMAGSPVYEQDLNNNGVKDGWEYDRGVDAFGNLGPPDGVIGPRDAQAAFAQYSRNVRCTSGFNLAKPSCTTNVGGPPTLGTGRDCDFQPAYPGVLGDGCVDTEDTNANDPWGQLYSVPVPALLADHNALRDNVATVRDAQAVFAYFRAGATSGSPVYEQDLNQNGVKDGWEYDRGINHFGQLGPPDGAITAVDAQAAFAQFAHAASCTSGYNMQNK